MRILLIDDTFTSGARLQSAASALALAGATVVAAFTLGRFIRPDYNVESQELGMPQSLGASTSAHAVSRDDARASCAPVRAIVRRL
jgi:hypothetical protein